MRFNVQEKDAPHQRRADGRQLTAEKAEAPPERECRPLDARRSVKDTPALSSGVQLEGIGALRSARVTKREPPQRSVDMCLNGANLRTTSCTGVSRGAPSGRVQKRADRHHKGGAGNYPLPAQRVEAQEQERGTQPGPPGRSYLRSEVGCNHRHPSPCTVMQQAPARGVPSLRFVQRRVSAERYQLKTQDACGDKLMNRWGSWPTRTQDRQRPGKLRCIRYPDDEATGTELILLRAWTCCTGALVAWRQPRLRPR